MKQLEIKNGEQIIDVNESSDYYIKAIIDQLTEVKQRITFNFNKANISSQLKIDLLLESESDIELEVIIIGQRDTTGIESGIEMNALLLNPKAKIKFIPSLEINEKDVLIDHSSSIGPPDQEVVAYAKSRGLSYNDLVNLFKENFNGDR